MHFRALAVLIVLGAAGPQLIVPTELFAQKKVTKTPTKQKSGNADAKQRETSDRNLQALTIAVMDYQEAKGHFPPAVLKGADGKTLRSWRVEILPFINASFLQPGEAAPYKALFDEYKQNEPWDSPNNKKVLAKMPEVFRAPTAAEKSTSTCYFALTGKGTLFDGPKGVTVGQIDDGSFSTILLVESTPAVPWTQPVDIPIDTKKALPKLGGIYKEGFFAVDAGGSRHFLKTGIKESDLTALITRDGGEKVEFPDGKP